MSLQAFFISVLLFNETIVGTSVIKLVVFDAALIASKRIFGLKNSRMETNNFANISLNHFANKYVVFPSTRLSVSPSTLNFNLAVSSSHVSSFSL